MLKNPFFDDNFLNQLTLNRNREVFARITALTKSELPIEFIQGKVTGGSINIDGTSAVRRTCSLSMIAKEVNINDFYWGLKNKFKLEIGIKNIINPDYPDIIWFKQGIYVITSFNTSQSTNNFTINISGKDKMCLLNGDLSGALPHSTDFGVEEYYDKTTNTTTYNRIPIKNIIREAVQNFGGELPHNIIINDLDDAGLMLLEYRGDSPLYMFYDIEKGVFTNISTKGSMLCYIKNENAYIGPYPIDNSEGNFIKYNNLSDLIASDATVVVFESNKAFELRNHYTIAKFEYGMTPGYKLTDLTYAGELIANVGESLTSILDKIKNMLGNFEYFYDIDGRFVFRKRMDYITTPWNSSESSGEVYMDAAASSQSKIFNLTNGHLITSFANTPNLLHLRNDYSVWGKYKTAAGAEVPIHMRYVVDKKPTSYHAIRPLKQHIVTKIQDRFGLTHTKEEDKFFNGPVPEPYDSIPMVSELSVVKVSDAETQYITSYYAKDPFTSKDYDWRELIYQMALDYRKLYHEDDFSFKLQEKNKNLIYGKTGYEPYYTDIEGFWRLLYNPNPEAKLTVIDATDASSAYQLHLSGFRKLNEAEKKAATVEDIGKYYIIPGLVNNNCNENTLYPFKKGCYLTKGVVYYLLDANGKLTKTTSNITELNSIDINSIYVLTGVDATGANIYRKFLEVCFLDCLKNDQLYIMEDELKFNDMITDQSMATLFESFPSELKYKNLDNFGTLKTDHKFSIEIQYYETQYDFFKADEENAFWNKNIVDSPESLLFWFDFLDTEGTEMAKYSVSAIGTRSKSINDSDVKSIYYRDIPSIIFTIGQDNDQWEPKTGYTYANLPAHMENLFTVSSQGKSAKGKIDELLYDYLYCTESANISAIPIYHLEPNGKIYIQDLDSGINGEYMVNKITLPLAYNGTMSFTAVKTISNDMLIF